MIGWEMNQAEYDNVWGGRDNGRWWVWYSVWLGGEKIENIGFPLVPIIHNLLINYDTMQTDGSESTLSVTKFIFHYW